MVYFSPKKTSKTSSFRRFFKLRLCLIYEDKKFEQDLGKREHAEKLILRLFFSFGRNNKHCYTTEK